jgi:hypothetical protein
VLREQLLRTRRVTESLQRTPGVPEQVLRAVATAGSDRRPNANRHQPSREAQPSVVIAAFARAKLLGIKLLTLDARIVLAPADAGSDITSVAAQARRVSSVVERPIPRLPSGRRPDLAYAVRLLEEGTKTLNDSRAERSLDIVSPE